MKIKKIMLGLVGIAAIASLTACSSTNSKTSAGEKQMQTIKKNGELVVAISPDYPPFEYKAIVNGKDTDVGVDIDIAKAIAKNMDVKLVLSNMSFNNVLGAVSTGKADIAISGIAATKERMKTFDFSDVYYNSANKIIIKKSEMNKYKSLSDFKGKSIGGQTGSMQAMAIQKKIKSANLVSLTSAADEINEVKAGKIAGTVMEGMVAKSYVEANPDLVISTAKVPELPDDAGSAVAIHKGSTAVKKEVNATIRKMKKSGELSKIIDEEYAASQKLK